MQGEMFERNGTPTDGQVVEVLLQVTDSKDCPVGIYCARFDCEAEMYAVQGEGRPLWVVPRERRFLGWRELAIPATVPPAVPTGHTDPELGLMLRLIEVMSNHTTFKSPGSRARVVAWFGDKYGR